MTPLTPNPQGPKSLQQGQNDVSPVNQDCPVLFNFLDQFQENDHVSKDHKPVLHYGGSSSSINPQQLYNQSSDSAMVDQSIARDNILPSPIEVEDSTKRKDPMEAKWVASKMRLMKMLMIPERSYGAAKKEDKAIIKKATASDATTPPSNGGFQNEMYQGSPTARVCVECEATSTPLWRSGPKGPKSLCNACGIRQRKARRAEAEAGSSLATSTKIKGHDNEKEKKLSVKKCTQFKKKNKTTPTAAAATADSSSSDEMTERLNFFLLKVRKKSGYEDTTEEVADTALLLMDISCGYVYP